jgi:5-formyltetrahydrofolate cyclo-ligase
VTAHAEGTPIDHLQLMTNSSTAVQKTEIRRNIRMQRRQLSTQQRAESDLAINQNLLIFVSELNISSLSAFWPFDGEPDLRSSLAQLDANGVEIALPVLGSEQQASMSLHRWSQQTVMVENQYKIPEPSHEPMLDPLDLDVLLIPLVAWDRKGCRLGMGAAYYDRMLAPLPASDGPRLIGVAYGLQEVSAVPVDQHDVPLHGLISENGRIKFT